VPVSLGRAAVDKCCTQPLALYARVYAQQRLFTITTHHVSPQFDYGVANLVNYLRRLPQGIVVSANLNATARPDLANLVQPYTIIELGGTGVRVRSPRSQSCFSGPAMACLNAICRWASCACRRAAA
jgi:hypothetical protein